ncbi:MAG TPA: low-specificity L-threonine aldolase [Anaerolineae bacterium]|nr:low-specificity L-threonine aldolase [Anaerolineae bacterium]
MDKIDLRSDTVTWPTVAMREAMAAAPVGDDVYGEDPTILALEGRAAELVGMESALFVASGTMGNLVGILTHGGRGDEAIVGADAHTFYWEGGGMATLGGITPRPLPTDHSGRMDLDQVRQAIRADDPHFPRSRLILTENSYGAKYGAAIPADYFAQLRQIADEAGLSVHLDGARFFNAVTALGVEPTEITQYVDSISICLSKGLCAPVGSILCGSAEFIGRARRIRKSVGGGMRQAGILGAAGLIALDEMRLRLAEDHARARRIATGLAEIPGIEIELERVQTNILYFRVTADVSSRTLVNRLREEANILLDSDNEGQPIRIVTHYWIDDAAVDKLLKAIREIVA